MGSDEVTATREQLGYKYGEFEVPQSAYDFFRAHAAEGAKKQEEWNALWAKYQEAEPELAAQFRRVVIDKRLPEGWADCLPKATPVDSGKATRLWAHDCLDALASMSRAHRRVRGPGALEHDADEVHGRLPEGLLRGPQHALRDPRVRHGRRLQRGVPA